MTELKGKVARAFEAKISKETSPRQKWILKEAVETYKKIKLDIVGELRTEEFGILNLRDKVSIRIAKKQLKVIERKLLEVKPLKKQSRCDVCPINVDVRRNIRCCETCTKEHPAYEEKVMV